MARQGYAHELVHASTFPVVLSLLEGGVVGVLAVKAFNAEPWQYTMIAAAPMFANMTSLLWSRLARGRKKVRAIVELQLAVLAVVLAIALLPTNDYGAGMLVAMVILGRCLLSGVITLRSVVWRANYRRAARARITGKLALLMLIITALAPLGAYALIDLSEQAFRFVYAGSLAFGLFGIIAMSRVRLRHEKEILRHEMEDDAHPQPRGDDGAIYEFDRKRRSPQFWRVLKQDQTFRRYMICQFLAGLAMMSAETVMVFIIAGELTSGIESAYTASILLTATIPLLLAVFTMPAWAKVLDATHIVRFRVKQGGLWMGLQILNLTAALVLYKTGNALMAFPLFVLCRITLGMIRGGGMLAWNLGHNDFADRRMVAVYMGIHVTLTGIRGMIAPAAGMMLFTGWSGGALSWIGIGSVPAFSGLGPWIFAVSFCFAAAATTGFWLLARSMEKGQTPAEGTVKGAALGTR